MNLQNVEIGDTINIYHTTGSRCAASRGIATVCVDDFGRDIGSTVVPESDWKLKGCVIRPDIL